MVRYGHRFSHDFDVVTMPESNANLGELVALLPINELLMLEERHDTLIFELLSVHCSFFEYRYPMLRRCAVHEDYGVAMASDEDIAAMKAVAIIQRGKKKDFYDLWYLIGLHRWGLEELMGFCSEKYGAKFSPGVLLKALVFFEDAERDEMPDIEDRWDEVKDYFVRLVRAAMDETM